ncbi:hypothetical protein [uncultured Paraglaciecola sp.]|uniref:hypothetical protein n=1 Tax=uncultured Paraglaciecola sp. TaxID=1765024 RepID=UPI00261AAD5C|nr:hypothetical protein [uncultured Paraglaciecola sp.]
MRFLTIILLLFSSPNYSAGTYNQILDGMMPNSITIIGESHQRPETVQFFESLITEYLQHNKCLTIALEIASSQQILLDEMADGKAVATDIDISPIIDHPPFRTLIADLVEKQKNNDCLKLIAIDGWIGIDTTRDEWMARVLNEQRSRTPVLALLGNLHTLKKVDWNQAMTKGSPHVAEILASQGHSIKTYPQMWTNRACNDWNQFIPADAPQAVGLLNTRLISLLNAFNAENAADTIDGIILWECDERQKIDGVGLD